MHYGFINAPPFCTERVYFAGFWPRIPPCCEHTAWSTAPPAQPPLPRFLVYPSSPPWLACIPVTPYRPQPQRCPMCLHQPLPLRLHHRPMCPHHRLPQRRTSPPLVLCVPSVPPPPPLPPSPPHTPAPWAPAAELFSCAVHVCRPREDLFQLFVFVKQDRTIALDVGLGDTVETVKAKIQDKEGIPSEQQHLVFGAIVLQDGRTLADYDVSGGCMLDLSFRFVSTQRWPQAFPVILHNVQCVCSFLSSLSLQDKASRSNIRGVSCVRVHAWTSTHRGICGVCCRHRAGTSSSSFRLSPLPPSRSVWG
jgi:hypothetical protein